MKNFNFISKIKEKYQAQGKKGKRLVFLAVAAVVLMVVICISTLIPKKSNAQKQTHSITTVSVTEYAKNLEKKLEEMLLSINSVERVSVFVLVDSTPKIEYLTDVEESTSTNSSGTTTTTRSESVVFEKNGSISSAVIVTTTMPKVMGVMIVINEIPTSTKYSILSAISVVLNVDESSISIIQER